MGRLAVDWWGGRSTNSILCTIQVTKSLSAGARLVFPFGVVPSPHADISGALQVRVRRPEAEVFEKVGDPIPLSNAPWSFDAAGRTSLCYGECGGKAQGRSLSRRTIISIQDLATGGR